MARAQASQTTRLPLPPSCLPFSSFSTSLSIALISSSCSEMGYNPPPGWQGPPQMRPYATPRAPENHSYPASSSHYSVPAYTGPPSHSYPSASANQPYSYNTAPSTYQNPPPAARPWAGPPVRPYQSLPGQVSRGPPSAAPPTAYQYGSHGPMTSQTGYASNLPNPTSAASSPESYDPHSPASTLPASSFTGYPGATSSTRPVSSQQPYQPVPANTAQYGYSVTYAEDRGPPRMQGRPVFSYQPPIPHPQNNSQSRVSSREADTDPGKASLDLSLHTSSFLDL